MEYAFVIGQFALFGGLLYFILVRPENKRRKAVAQMQSSLSKGDQVVTAGGLHARVHAIEESTITLITDDGVKLKFERKSITKKAD